MSDNDGVILDHTAFGRNDLEKALNCCQILLYLINSLDLDKKLTLDEVGIISVIAEVTDILLRKHGLKEYHDHDAAPDETRR
jgi:hypothetical protein